jgi:hypothetical protein
MFFGGSPPPLQTGKLGHAFFMGFNILRPTGIDADGDEPGCCDARKGTRYDRQRRRADVWGSRSSAFR